MKKCGRCKEGLPFEAFNKNKSKKDGLGTMCRECWKSYYKDKYYKLGKEKERLLRNNQTKRKAMTEFIKEYKEAKPCADCGIKYPSYVMDFDHLDGFEKEFNIGSASQRYTLEKVKIEIEKCEVVCANCHRIRTYNRRTNTERVAGIPC